jgi:hypothetical protein
MIATESGNCMKSLGDYLLVVGVITFIATIIITGVCSAILIGDHHSFRNYFIFSLLSGVGCLIAIVSVGCLVKAGNLKSKM